MLVNIEGLSEGSASREAEAGAKAGVGNLVVVPSGSLGAGGSGSGGIAEPGAFAKASVAVVEVFSCW